MLNIKIDKTSFLKAILVSLTIGFLTIFFLVLPTVHRLEGEDTGWNLSFMGKLVVIVSFVGIFLISLYFSYAIITWLKLPKEERIKRRDRQLEEMEKYPYGRDYKKFLRQILIMLIILNVFFLAFIYLFSSSQYFVIPWDEIATGNVTFALILVSYYLYKRRKKEG